MSFIESSHQPIVVPDSEVIVHNDVSIRVEYGREPYISTTIIATLFVEVDDASKLPAFEDWRMIDVLNLKAQRIDKWWATEDGVNQFEFFGLLIFPYIYKGWLEQKQKQAQKLRFNQELASLKKELGRLQKSGRPTAVLEDLIDEVDYRIYRFEQGWRETAPEAKVAQALRAAKNEADRIEDGGVELLIDYLMEGKISHQDVERNQRVIDQVKIWSIRTGGFVDMFTPESLRAFYRTRLEGVTRVSELQKYDLALNLADYNPTALLDELEYAPDTVEIQGRKTMTEVKVDYDLYEIDGQPVPVGIITIPLSTYERNAAEYGKRSQFPALPHDIRLLIQVVVDGKIIATGFDDNGLASRIAKYKKAKQRGKAIAGVGEDDWFGRRPEPIGSSEPPPWAKGHAARSRWR